MSYNLEEINDIFKDNDIHTVMVKNALHIYCIYRSFTIYDSGIMYAYGKRIVIKGHSNNDILHLIAIEYQENNEELISDKGWISFLEKMGYGL